LAVLSSIPYYLYEEKYGGSADKKCRSRNQGQKTTGNPGKH